jgi:hypothetical protein
MNPSTLSFRTSARRVPLISARIPKQSFRYSFRRYSTEAPPPKSSNTALYTTIGLTLTLLGGIGYYAYSSPDTATTSVKSGAQAAQSALKLAHTKADYQKVDRINLSAMTTPRLNSRGQVYNKIAHVIDDAGDYDGMSYRVSVHATLLPSSTCQMALMVPFSSVSPGTALVPSIRRLRLAAGTVVDVHDR